jgi:hypothetical protein
MNKLKIGIYHLFGICNLDFGMMNMVLLVN